MRHAICYVSTAVPELSEDQVQEILDTSERNNNQEKITGILLFSDGNFFQVLEGNKERITQLYEKITRDKRHYNLIKILHREVGEAKFHSYVSSFSSVDTRYRNESLDEYIAQVEKLDFNVINAVRYILQKFTEGIK